MRLHPERARFVLGLQDFALFESGENASVRTPVELRRR